MAITKAREYTGVVSKIIFNSSSWKIMARVKETVQLLNPHFRKFKIFPRNFRNAIEIRRTFLPSLPSLSFSRCKFHCKFSLWRTFSILFLTMRFEYFIAISADRPVKFSLCHFAKKELFGEQGMLFNR